MEMRDLLEVRRKRAKVQMSYVCSIDAFRRNARRLEKEGMPRSAAYAQAYAVLAFACERMKREAGTILLAPEDGLDLEEWRELMEGLTRKVLERPLSV